MHEITLPAVRKTGKMSVEEALDMRRSVRKYQKTGLDTEEVGQLLWACDGRATRWGGRTAPSAGATFPLEIYLVAGAVKGIAPGLYHYDTDKHVLTLVQEGDLRKKLCQAAYNQSMIAEAPATIVIAAEFGRTTSRYGTRGERYVSMEAGHCGQNVHLQAESLGLGTVMVGAFEDRKVKETLGVKEDVLYMCPVGKK